jgi:ribonucleoside-diphosphate reductase alpha chain
LRGHDAPNGGPASGPNGGHATPLAVSPNKNAVLLRAEAVTVAMESRQTRLKVAEARLKGYEGDPCGGCGAFTLVRNGTCLKCVSCGATSGCS